MQGGHLGLFIRIPISLFATCLCVQGRTGAIYFTTGSNNIDRIRNPLSGALGGRALFSAQEGDANRTGDQALFGPTSATSVALSGPNNLAANFLPPKSMEIREHLTQQARLAHEIRPMELQARTLLAVVKVGILPMWMCLQD